MCAGRGPCPEPNPLSAARRSGASRGRQTARGSLFKDNDEPRLGFLDGPGRREAAGAHRHDLDQSARVCCDN